MIDTFSGNIYISGVKETSFPRENNYSAPFCSFGVLCDFVFSAAVSQERLLIKLENLSPGRCPGILLQYVTDAFTCVLSSMKARA